MELPDVPVVVFEDEFAREENAVRKVAMYNLGELGKLFDGVSAEGEIGFRGQSAMVTVVHEVGESLRCLSAQSFYVLSATVTLRVDRPNIHEDAVLEVAGELPANPLQGIDATATARADNKNCRGRPRVEPGRIVNGGVLGPAERLVRDLDLALDAGVVGVVEEAEADDRSGDDHGH